MKFSVKQQFGYKKYESDLGFEIYETDESFELTYYDTMLGSFSNAESAMEAAENHYMFEVKGIK